MNRFLLPLGVFVVLIAFLWVGLSLKPREVPSPLIGKPAPTFRLPLLHDPARTITPEELRGQVWVLNVWASWCAPCLQEHPLLVEMEQRKIVTIVGLNYKNQSEDSIAWLRQHGNPYLVSAYDRDGNVGINWGVYGVPETFVIDKAGIIRHKITGVLTPTNIRDEIIPLIKELNDA